MDIAFNNTQTETTTGFGSVRDVQAEVYLAIFGYSIDFTVNSSSACGLVLQ